MGAAYRGFICRAFGIARPVSFDPLSSRQTASVHVARNLGRIATVTWKRDSLEYPHDHAIPQAAKDDTLGLETRRLYHQLEAPWQRRRGWDK
jgi:hypothetical protein